MDAPHFAGGRKLFYFYPVGDYHRQIVDSLITAEYEIYTLSDRRRGLPLMFQHHGAVVFFNIDEGRDRKQLIATLRDFCRQSSRRSIQLYLLSREEDRPEGAAALERECENCRLLQLPPTAAAAREVIHTQLGRLAVRGQRRYVRFGSSSRSVASIRFLRRGTAYRGTVHDISSAGLSFSLPQGQSAPLRCRLQDIEVDLGKGITGLSGSVTIRRRLPDDTLLYILMFDKGLPAEKKLLLRRTIHYSLQRQFSERLEQVAMPERESE
jgi:hypothetical protein